MQLMVSCSRSFLEVASVKYPVVYSLQQQETLQEQQNGRGGGTEAAVAVEVVLLRDARGMVRKGWRSPARVVASRNSAQANKS